MLGRLVEQVADCADADAQAHHEALALRVDRRVCHLSELLLEVARQQTITIGEGGKWRVVAHRTDRLTARQRHRCQQQREVFAGVAENALELRKRPFVNRDALLRPQIVKVQLVLVEPLTIGAPPRENALDLVVFNHAARGGVEHQHPTGLEAAGFDNLGLGDVEHANL